MNVFNKTIKKETENSIIDINLELCDCTGEVIFNNFLKIFPKYAGIFVLVYDVTNKESFNNLIKWADIAHNCRGNYTIAIIGNKNDLTEEKEVSIEDGENFANEMNAMFFEMSAINNENIDNIFNAMINNYYRDFPDFLDDEDK